MISIHSASAGASSIPSTHSAATINATRRKSRDNPGPKLTTPSAIPINGRRMPAMDGPMYRQSLSPPKLSHIANIKRLKQHPNRGYAKLRVHSASVRGNHDRTNRPVMTGGAWAIPIPHPRQFTFASSLRCPQYAQVFMHLRASHWHYLFPYFSIHATGFVPRSLSAVARR